MRKIVIIGVLISLLVGCSSVLLTGRKQLNLVSDSEIQAMSLTQYQSFLNSSDVVISGTNTVLVKKVGRKIAQAVEHYMKLNGQSQEVKNYHWEFNLVKGQQANAFCMPGGKVAVFEGILPYTQDETGLAVVLGHEVAHAIAKHSNERLSQQMLMQYGADLTDLLLTQKSTITRQTIATLYGIGAKVGIALPNSRKQELEADRLGLIFMAMAGYNPQKAIDFWQRMSAKGGSQSDFLSTHPSDSRRIAHIQKRLPEALKYCK
ncbi:MAG: peptidase M48 [Paludibacter sp.]|nr:MAG: peptidase M48 [Paludibacter sp.]